MRNVLSILAEIKAKSHNKVLVEDLAERAMGLIDGNVIQLDLLAGAFPFPEPRAKDFFETMRLNRIELSSFGVK